MRERLLLLRRTAPCLIALLLSAACGPFVASGPSAGYPPPPPALTAALTYAFGDVPGGVACFTQIAWREDRYATGDSPTNGHLGPLQISPKAWAFWMSVSPWPARWRPMNHHTYEDSAVVARWMFNAYLASGVNGYAGWVTRGSCRAFGRPTLTPIAWAPPPPPPPPETTSTTTSSP